MFVPSTDKRDKLKEQAEKEQRQYQEHLEQTRLRHVREVNRLGSKNLFNGKYFHRTLNSFLIRWRCRHSRWSAKKTGRKLSTRQIFAISENWFVSIEFHRQKTFSSRKNCAVKNKRKTESIQKNQQRSLIKFLLCSQTMKLLRLVGPTKWLRMIENSKSRKFIDSLLFLNNIDGIF